MPTARIINTTGDVQLRQLETAAEACRELARELGRLIWEREQVEWATVDEEVKYRVCPVLGEHSRWPLIPANHMHVHATRLTEHKFDNVTVQQFSPAAATGFAHHDLRGVDTTRVSYQRHANPLLPF